MNKLKSFQDYPKSSCNCYNCENKLYKKCVNNGVPTNLSITNCSVPKYFECDNRKIFRKNIEPERKTGYTDINPNFVKGKYSQDFQEFNCSKNTSCPKKQYASKDPRLVSPMHGGQVLTLNRPAFDSSVKLSNLNNPNLDNYGQKYQTYSDINAGYINYYTNKEQQDPFFSPNFTTPAKSIGILYRDPMGAMKPQYERNLKMKNPSTTSSDSFRYNLSWLQDSTEHREDLLARQMRKRNEQRWDPRWSNVKANVCEL